jgi:glycerol-3-phosphate cytidylyltransferase
MTENQQAAFGHVDLPDFLPLPALYHMHEIPAVMLKELRMLDKRVGFTCGAFDLGHAGHVAMFWEAKVRKVCDYLVVAIQSNPRFDRPNKNPPSETLQERYIRLYRNRDIDALVTYDTEAELEQFLRTYARKSGGFIDVRILDEEYKRKPFTGDQLPIDVHFNWRKHPWSTSQLKLRVHEDVELAKTAA